MKNGKENLKNELLSTLTENLKGIIDSYTDDVCEIIADEYISKNSDSFEVCVIDSSEDGSVCFRIYDDRIGDFIGRKFEIAEVISIGAAGFIQDKNIDSYIGTLECAIHELKKLTNRTK